MVSAPYRYFPRSRAAQRVSGVRLRFVEGSGRHRVPRITVGVWLLCRLLTSVQSRRALPHHALCCRIRVRWVLQGFRPGPQSDSPVRTDRKPGRSPQIRACTVTARDGGNADIAGANICHDTTAGFTLPREFVAIVVLCPLDPAAKPCIRFLFIGSSFCTWASFEQSLAVLPLPSASRYDRQHG